MDRLPRPSAVLFDMDGTLTQPLLDFPRIKAEMGIGSQPILEALEAMDVPARQRAEEVLRRHEIEAAGRSTLNEGCREMLALVNELKIPAAVVTRNDRECAATVFRLHGLMFQCVITRDDPPFKPNPAPLLLACRRLEIEPGNAWMVGDGQYDIEAGNAAGMVSIWLSHGKTKQFSAEPTRSVRDLHELSRMLTACS